MNIRINGLMMNYQERGLPQGLPVVFIHGFPFSHAMWNSQMMAIPQGTRAISYDVRGHGSSEAGDGQFSIEYFADDLIGLLNELGIGKAVLCGLSMGGYIALRAHERHPDRVQGLILCDTRSEADSNEARIKRANQAKGVKENGVKAFAEGFVKAVFAPATFKSNPAAIESIRTIIEKTSPLAISGTLLALAARTDTTASLASVNVPTLILVGEHDSLTPPSASEAMHKHIKGSTLHVIPDAAHMSNIENAPVFNKHLVEFVKGIQGA
ncbi:MAG TPA: alpha/beta fold hydrolase [Bacteroidota bacterium]